MASDADGADGTADLMAPKAGQDGAKLFSTLYTYHVYLHKEVRMKLGALDQPLAKMAKLRDRPALLCSCSLVRTRALALQVSL